MARSPAKSFISTWSTISGGLQLNVFRAGASPWCPTVSMVLLLERRACGGAPARTAAGSETANGERYSYCYNTSNICPPNSSSAFSSAKAAA